MHDARVPTDRRPEAWSDAAGSSRSTSATAGPRSPWSRSRARCAARRCAPSTCNRARRRGDPGRRRVVGRAARGGARGDRRRRRRPRRSCTPSRSRGSGARRCRSAPTAEPVGEVLLWADTRARDLAREVIGGPVSISGFAPQKVLPVRAPHRRSADAERRRPHRPLAAAARAAARRLRQDHGDPRAGRLSRACGSPAGPPRRRRR